MLGNANDVTVLKTVNADINGDLTFLIKDLKTPIDYNNQYNKTPDQVKDLLNTASTNQQEVMRANEGSKKKFAEAQKYGYVLQDIAKLLDLINLDYKDLSLEDVTKELEKLINSRNTTTEQLSFNYYQDLFSSTTSELIEIEASYQAGSLSGADAYDKIINLSSRVKDNCSDLPLELCATKDELQDLLQMYEEGFKEEASNKLHFNISVFEMNDESKLRFVDLNNKTQELSNKVQSLHTDLSKFEPNVNLNGLYEQLKNTDEFFKGEWNANDASTKVADLKLTTDTLTSQQILKNKERESFQNEISNTATEIKEVSNKNLQQLAINIYQAANNRAETTQTKVDKIEELAEANLPENVASQFGAVMQEQTQADEINALELSAEEAVEKNLFDEDLNNLTQDEIYKLQDYLKQLSLQRSPDLHPTEDDENQ